MVSIEKDQLLIFDYSGSTKQVIEQFRDRLDELIERYDIKESPFLNLWEYFIDDDAGQIKIKYKHLWNSVDIDTELVPGLLLLLLVMVEMGISAQETQSIFYKRDDVDLKGILSVIWEEGKEAKILLTRLEAENNFRVVRLEFTPDDLEDYEFMKKYHLEVYKTSTSVAERFEANAKICDFTD